MKIVSEVRQGQKEAGEEVEGTNQGTPGTNQGPEVVILRTRNVGRVRETGPSLFIPIMAFLVHNRNLRVIQSSSQHFGNFP